MPSFSPVVSGVVCFIGWTWPVRESVLGSEWHWCGFLFSAQSFLGFPAADTAMCVIYNTPTWNMSRVADKIQCWLIPNDAQGKTVWALHLKGLAQDWEWEQVISWNDGKDQGRLLWYHSTNAEFAWILKGIYNPDWGERVRPGKGWEFAIKDEVRCEMTSVHVRFREERAGEFMGTFCKRLGAREGYQQWWTWWCG